MIVPEKEHNVIETFGCLPFFAKKSNIRAGILMLQLLRFYQNLQSAYIFMYMARIYF